jgi:hypothetical protein
MERKLLTDSMDTFYVGDRVELIMGPDKARFDGVLTNWDDVAVYVNGLGFPQEDILEMNPL